MAAREVYVFNRIEPSASAGVEIRGYSRTQAVSYGAVVNTYGRINMTQGETSYYGATVTRAVYVQNLNPDDSCSATVLEIIEEIDRTTEVSPVP
jgi:hypothetical protein